MYAHPPCPSTCDGSAVPRLLVLLIGPVAAEASGRLADRGPGGVVRLEREGWRAASIERPSPALQPAPVIWRAITAAQRPPGSPCEPHGSCHGDALARRDDEHGAGVLNGRRLRHWPQTGWQRLAASSSFLVFLLLLSLLFSAAAHTRRAWHCARACSSGCGGLQRVSVDRPASEKAASSYHYLYVA
jgi:hypothetical protein